MNSKENSELKKIAKSVMVINGEVGVLQNDMKWVKRVIFYIAGIVSVGVGKSLFFG
ncbi:unnamed protein product [marine sediment metagenome]|uniref:Uncharacterized protein n=1 Tax=marine sediment metagenome TaxID=412755 RepID=X0SPP4_9ZZZZ